MASASDKKQVISPATVCGVSPAGTVKCCALVIETYISPEFPETEIVNVEEHCAPEHPEDPEQVTEALSGHQSVG